MLLSRLLSLSMALRYRIHFTHLSMEVFNHIFKGRYAAALFSAANKNGSLDAVEKVSTLDRGPNFLKCLVSIFDQPFFKHFEIIDYIS